MNEHWDKAVEAALQSFPAWSASGDPPCARLVGDTDMAGGEVVWDCDLRPNLDLALRAALPALVEALVRTDPYGDCDEPVDPDGAAYEHTTQSLRLAAARLAKGEG